MASMPPPRLPNLFVVFSTLAALIIGAGVVGGFMHSSRGRAGSLIGRDQLVMLSLGLEAPIYTTKDKTAVLTFDDGPDPVWTPAVLAKLREHHVRAIFFLLGSHVDMYPQLVRAIVADGHVIGNHSWDHPDFGQLSPAAAATQIDRTNAVLQRVTGSLPVLFRPPYGTMGKVDADLVSQRRMRTLMWNESPSDYAMSSSGSRVISDSVTSAATGGGLIILLHDGSPNGHADHTAMVNALDNILNDLQSRGYRLNTDLPPPDPHSEPVPLVPGPSGESGHT